MIRFTPEQRTIFGMVYMPVAEQGIGAESSEGETINSIEVVQGSLPGGLSMAANGIFSGTPMTPGRSQIVVKATTATETQYCGFAFYVNGELNLETHDISVASTAGSVAYEVELQASGGFTNNNGQDNYTFAVVGANKISDFYTMPIDPSTFAWMDISGGVNSWRANHILMLRPRWMGNYQLFIGIRDLRNIQGYAAYKWLNVTATEPMPQENLWFDFLSKDLGTLPPAYDAFAQVGKRVIIDLIQPGPGTKQTVTFYQNDPAYNGWQPPQGFVVLSWSVVQEIPNTGNPDAPQPLNDDKDWFNTHKDDPLTGLWDMNSLPTPEEMNEAITEFRAIYNEMINEVDRLIYGEITPQLNNPVNRFRTLDGGQEALNNETARIYDTQNKVDEVIFSVSRLNNRFQDFLHEHQAIFNILKMDFTTPPDAVGNEELLKEISEAKRLYEIIQNWIASRKAWDPAAMLWVTRALEALTWVTQKLDRSSFQLLLIGSIVQQIDAQAGRISNFPNVSGDTVIDVLSWAVDQFFSLRDMAHEVDDIADTTVGQTVVVQVNYAISQLLSKIIYVIESIL